MSRNTMETSRILSQEKGEKSHHFPLDRVFPCGSAGKESACKAGDLGSIPGLGRSPEEGKGYPLQNSGLENFMDCIVPGVTKGWTRLSDLHFHFQILPIPGTSGYTMGLNSFPCPLVVGWC